MNEEGVCIIFMVTHNWGRNLLKKKTEKNRSHSFSRAPVQWVGSGISNRVSFRVRQYFTAQSRDCASRLVAAHPALAASQNAWPFRKKNRLLLTATI